MALRMYHSKTEIKDVAIKPCPFCGSTNLVITEEESFNRLCEENGRSLISIECKICNVEAKLYTIPNNNYWLGVGLMIAKWNTRNGGNKDAD